MSLDNVIVPIIIALIGISVPLINTWVNRSKQSAETLKIYDEIEQRKAADALERITALEKRCDDQDTLIARQAKQINTQREQIAALISQLAEAKISQDMKDKVIMTMRIEIDRLQREVNDLRVRLARYEPDEYARPDNE